MMNKGLEMIEASYLFAMPPERIDVLIHPQSVIHSLVEYTDGSTLAQLGAAGHAHADRLRLSPGPTGIAWPAPKLDLAAIGQLTFEAPGRRAFPGARPSPARR